MNRDTKHSINGAVLSGIILLGAVLAYSDTKKITTDEVRNCEQFCRNSGLEVLETADGACFCKNVEGEKAAEGYYYMQHHGEE